MEAKTKFGLSISVVAAITCFISLFGGYVALVLLVGYILICEDDPWLRQTAVGVLLISLIFSLLSTVLGLIPDIVGIINNLFAIFNEYFSIPFVTRVISFITSILTFLRNIVLLALGVLSLLGKKIKVPAMEKFVAKYLSHPSKD